MAERRGETGKSSGWNQRIQRLRSLGFADAPARAYLALLTLGAPSVASEIAKLARIPTSKIYTVLDSLRARGAVEVRPEFPRRYAAVPVEDLLDAVRKEHEAAARALAEEREVYAGLFSTVAKPPEAGEVALFRGLEPILAQCLLLVARAKTQVVVLGQPALRTRRKPLLLELEKAAARGVGIVVNVQATDDDSWHEIAARLGGTSRTAPESFRRSGALVVDRQRAIFIDVGHAPASANQPSETAVVFENSGLVEVLLHVLDPPASEAREVAPETP